MISKDFQQKYNEKLNRINKAIDKEIPDRIPVLPYMDTWMFHNAGISVKDAYTKDPEILFQGVKNFTDDFYVDGLMGSSNIIPIKALSNFGEGLYVVTDDGIQIVGGKGHSMNEDEYPELIKNPYKFFADKIIPRKYPKLVSDPVKTMELLKKGWEDILTFNSYNRTVNARIENELGIPNLPRASAFVAPDIILDYLRDFVGVSTDLRRRPQQFLEAAAAIQDLVIKKTIETYKTPEDRKGIIFSPQHLPTYLKPKDFEKFYFPFMKKMIEELSVKRGYTILFYMENQWMPYMEILQDLPDNARVVGMLEFGDLKEIKDKIGNKITIAGGMRANTLRYGTVNECIDEAKYVIDTLAPGGNFIYSVDMILMNLSDAKPENLKATLQYVHENGKY